MEENEIGGACSAYVGEERRGEVPTCFCWGTGRPRLDGKNIEMNLQEVGWRGLGLMWLRVGTGGELLCMR